MPYDFVAAPDHWPRNGTPIRAIVVHMAEGGGTVSWLTRDDGNSSHYVIEYSGRIVQMVHEDRSAGSINPKALRVNNNSPFTYLGETITYGYTAAKGALGAYWSDPNEAVIAIEIEGFAGPNSSTKADPLGGPNDAQEAALVALVKDIRSRHGALPLLGHADFQAYKACPGKRIPWTLMGGHGRVPTEEVMKIEFKVERWTLDGGAGITTFGAPYRSDGTVDYGWRLGLITRSTGRVLEMVARHRLTNPSAALNEQFYTALARYDDNSDEIADLTSQLTAATNDLNNCQVTVEQQAAIIASLKTTEAEYGALKVAIKKAAE